MKLYLLFWINNIIEKNDYKYYAFNIFVYAKFVYLFNKYNVQNFVV